MNINEALTKLDPSNDEHWTNDGLPRMDTLHALLGTEDVTRADVTNTAPDFTRDKAREAETVDKGEDDAASTDNGNGPEEEGSGTGEGTPSLDTHPESDDKAEAESADEVQSEVEAAAAPEPSDEVPTSAEAEGEHVQPTEPDEQAEDGVLNSEEWVNMTVAQRVNALPNDATVLEEVRAELTEHQLRLQGEAEQAKKQADELADTVNAINRRLDEVQRQDPNHGTENIRNYIASQNKMRLERARRYTKFMADHDVSPDEVAKAADGRSALDRAMSHRKAARGAKRPVYIPQRVN